MIHLTYTGYDAGTLLCGLPRDESSQRLVHAAYAPLSNPTFRADVCPHCLKIWADYAYDKDDVDIPDYIKAIREK